MTLRIRYNREQKWTEFEAEAKGYIYKQVILTTMLKQCYSPAQVVTSLVNSMRSALEAQPTR